LGSSPNQQYRAHHPYLFGISFRDHSPQHRVKADAGYQGVYVIGYQMPDTGYRMARV